MELGVALDRYLEVTYILMQREDVVLDTLRDHFIRTIVAGSSTAFPSSITINVSHRPDSHEPLAPPPMRNITSV